MVISQADQPNSVEDFRVFSTTEASSGCLGLAAGRL
jgi:hypothetical protein